MRIAVKPKKHSFFLSWCLLTPVLALWVMNTSAALRYAGVNLAGAEFGATVLPGTYNTQYTYPTQTEVDYFRSKGLNTFRLCFRWERLQQATNSVFNAAEFNRFHSFVSATTAKGMYVILDPHNFQRYYPDPGNFQSSAQGLVGSAVPDSAFVDFWSRLAAIYKTNDHVIFNLMNEPNSLPTEQLVTSENAAIAGIRAAGATNLILVPGNQWTGAWAWSFNFYGTPNAQAMLDIVDSANNFAFDVHQYLDSDNSGSHTNIVSETIGRERLEGFTDWLKTNNRRGFLGEFAVPNAIIGANASQNGDEALTNMLSHIQENSDVWLGWTWWAAGPWWGEYMFTLEKTGGGADRPAMPVLKSFIPVPTPSLIVVSGTQFQFIAPPGFVFQPEVSSNLAGVFWSNYGLSTIGNGQTVTVNMSGDSQSFYRVRVNHVP
jgi:endoglucanase